LAHHGILFLDELPEFTRASLEGLREPLEERAVTISRAAYSIHYPAHFQLVAAMNPCPCGYWQDGSTRCQCTQEQVRRYQSRLSGPFLDRMDLMVATAAVPLQELVTHQPKQTVSSAVVRARVADARVVQQKRAGMLNATLSQTALAEYCALDVEEQGELQASLDQLGFSARSYHRLLKVARTIADLDKAEHIQKAHWQEALMLKKMRLMVS